MKILKPQLRTIVAEREKEKESRLLEKITQIQRKRKRKEEEKKKKEEEDDDDDDDDVEAFNSNHRSWPMLVY